MDTQMAHPLGEGALALVEDPTDHALREMPEHTYQALRGIVRHVVLRCARENPRNRALIAVFDEEGALAPHELEGIEAEWIGLPESESARYTAMLREMLAFGRFPAEIPLPIAALCIARLTVADRARGLEPAPFFPKTPRRWPRWLSWLGSGDGR